jgi:hypothetical protein
MKRGVRSQESGVRSCWLKALLAFWRFKNLTKLGGVIKTFTSLLDGTSLQYRPPRTWNALKDNDVSSCTCPPQHGGEWCTQGNKYFFDYEETTGGQSHEKRLLGCEACL